MAKRSKDFDDELGTILRVLDAIDTGRVDHLFVNAETKTAAKEDWMKKWEAVVRQYARAANRQSLSVFPHTELFYVTPDGKIGLDKKPPV